MRPKDFQVNVLTTFSAFLTELGEQEKETRKRMALARQGKLTLDENDRDYFARTWEALGRRGMLPAARAEDGSLRPPSYARRENSRGEMVPHVCLKLPTGGGKTLLGVAALERMNLSTGLVLWVTPSRAIYRQTLNAFARRMHPYRQWLERACGGRVKLLRKKNEFSLADVESHLCVLPIMLQAADRKNDQGFLKIYRDSGKYAGFFPDPDDRPANDELLEAHPDLHTNKAPRGSRGAVKHSLYNVLKMARPIIVVDEAHNAYTENRRQRLCEFNPRFVLELSATPEPGVSNILADVPGMALKREQMIKLPLRIHNLKNADWKYTLAKAKERLDSLEQEAQALQGEAGRYIRPIMLIRVERVGREQRDGRHIHAEDVRDYLTTQLQVPGAHIRRKTAEKDEIADEDLTSPYSPVRYILTKDALREGWDCPFAYVLTLLDSTNTARALTQMTGRILRQPDAELTGRAPLDESYIYCFDRDVSAAVAQVKRGLEAEGMSDLAQFVQQGGAPDAGLEEGTLRVVSRRPQFQDLQIFLPQVLHRVAENSRRYRPLDYESDVLGEVDWNAVVAAPLDIDALAVDDIREVEVAVDLPGADFNPGKKKSVVVNGELSIEFFTRRLCEVLPNSWLAAQVAQRALASLRKKHSAEEIFERRCHLSEVLKRRLAALVEQEAQQVFTGKLNAGDIRFELVADDSGFQFEQELRRIMHSGQQQLFHDDGDLTGKSLYEKVYSDEFNGLEKDFALYMDGHEAVTWRHRFAARQDYGLQGWKPHLVYPDFVVCVEKARHGKRRVLVLEIKGTQLSGNPDTRYKETLFQALETAKPYAVEYGDLSASGRRGKKKRLMSLEMLFENSYREKFEESVSRQ